MFTSCADLFAVGVGSVFALLSGERPAKPPRNRTRSGPQTPGDTHAVEDRKSTHIPQWSGPKRATLITRAFQEAESEVRSK